MSKPRKIAVVITARPSYSRIKTLLQAIEQEPALDLLLIVAASALLERYGSVIDHIEKDGFAIAAKVFNVLEGENLTAAAKTTGIGILELSTVFDNLKPDLVVTVADRFETMATAISASYMNIPLVHIQGGEVSGNIDEKVRHAITKLADYHFVASATAQQRVIQLGEEPHKVFCTGCPSIDLAAQLPQMNELPFDPYTKYGGVGHRPSLENGYLIVLQHPVTHEHEASRAHIELTLRVIDQLQIPTLWFWPNLDAGSDGTATGIRAYREQHELPHVHFFKNMTGEDFLYLLQFSKCLIGNSSAGIRECAFMGVPVVNIGSRQHRRDRGTNVIDVDYNEQALTSAIQQQLLQPQRTPSDVYGGGHAGKIMADLLKEIPLQFHKTITY
jgi:UDP-hydrolysing UDP-N-acetyl-D-glucosamine 2-epimerase